MAARALLVTGCDRRFFFLLRGMVRSIREKGGLDHVDLGFFDIDCDEVHRRWLEERFHVIVRPEPPFHPPAHWAANRRYLTSIIRACLPRYFPGYEFYIYSDVDVWVQDWSGFGLYLRAAATGALAITAQIDRAYRLVENERAFRLSRFLQMFDPRLSQSLLEAPYLNAGIFALAASAPHWDRWRAMVESAARENSEWFGINQSVLSYLLFHEGMPHHLLPASCNWQCHAATPLWDDARRCFVEPLLPHDPIRIMHLTYTSKEDRTDIRTVQGRTIENRRLTYGAYRRLRGPPP
jgi:hypothetical protein